MEEGGHKVQTSNCKISSGNVMYNQINITNIVCVRAKSLQSCPTLCDPMDYSLPGPSVHGILQARMLEWVAMLSPRRSF